MYSIADESCLLINIKRNPSWPGINAIHEGARTVGDSAIDHVNAAIIRITSWTKKIKYCIA